MMRKTHFSEPEENVGYSHCGYTLSEDFLPQRFAPIETWLMERMRLPDVTEEEFESLCNSQLDVFIKSVQPEVVGALESVERRYDALRSQLDEAQAHQHRLLGINRLCEMYADNRRAPLWYWGLYLVLILAAMAIFVGNFGLIFPEQALWIGLLSSLIVAAPSYLVMCEFLRRPDKDRFLRLIHWIGILTSILMVFGFAVARALAYLLLNGSASSTNYSSGSFLYNQSSSAVDTAQMIVALVTFLAAIATEVTFGARLYISIAEYRAARYPIERINGGLVWVEKELQKLQEELHQLGQQLAFLRGFEEMASVWKQAKLQELTLLFKDKQFEVRNELQRKIAQLPTSELRKLTA